MIKQEDTCYGVIIHGRALDKDFLAHSPAGAAPYLFWQRKNAVAHKRDLIKEGFTGCKVVKVRATYQTI